MEGFTFKKVEFDDRTLAEREKDAIDEVVNDEVDDQVADEVVDDTPADDTPPAVETTTELDDELVLSHIRNKYNKDVATLDDLFKEQAVAEELDLDVAAFNKYKKETGRSIEDFVNLNKDLESVDPKKLLSDFYKENGDDDEDISYRLNKFIFDEDLDSDEEIQEKKIAMKQELKRAKKHFEEQKEKYNIPLESREPVVSEADRSVIEAYEANKTAEAERLHEQEKQSKYFVDKTNELFSDKFEGFKFNVDGNQIVYKPTDITAEKAQMALGDLVGSYLDDKGYVKDIEGFQRAMTIASNPEKMANFFYEQGMAAAVSKFEKDGKNIDMVRGASTPATKVQGVQFKKVDSGNDSTFKIRKR